MGTLFGTDGVRGIANQDLTPELAYQLGRVGAYVLLKGQKKGKAVIGKDTRISGDLLEHGMIAGFLSMGVDVIKLGVIPTPAVAYLTRFLGADCGVMISASHNPAEYNGIKFFDQKGFKLPDEVEAEIEDYILNHKEIAQRGIGAEVGRILPYEHALEDYKAFLKSTVKNSFKGLSVALDLGNGAAYQVAPALFRELGAEVFTINDAPDGININHHCGSTHPEVLQQFMKEVGASVGITFDGDADRALAVNELGQIVDGDHIMAICGARLKREGALKGNTVVATVMSNIGFDLCMKEQGITVAKTKVGDRYVLEEMVAKGYSLGGEQSGHVIFLDHNTTGDGLLTAIQLVDTILTEGKPFSELSGMMTTYPQVLVNAKVHKDKKEAYLQDPEIMEEIRKIEAKLQGEGRVLIRPSGTEPLVRVMLEGKDQEELNQLATALAKKIEINLG